MNVVAGKIITVHRYLPYCNFWLSLKVLVIMKTKPFELIQCIRGAMTARPMSLTEEAGRKG